MATWCHQVREAYRKLQRALRRARGDQPDPKDDGAAPSHASSRARSGPEPAAEDDSEEEQDQDEEPGRPPSRPASSPKSRGKGKTKDHASPSRGSRGSGGSSSEDEDFSTLWDDLDLGLPEVLPTELIGWIMLRKSALNAAQRLNVLSSIGNSLKAEDVERGLRGAEDELRLVEREREGRPKGHSKGKHRNTFWIEQDDQWGILLTEEADAEDILEQNDVHWLSTNALEQAFPAWETPSTPSSRPDTEDRYGQEDGFFAADPQLPGAYESEAWNSVLWSSPDEAKPVVEAYAAYEEKMRTFQDSRRAHAAKQASRGFFPKGKWKGKGHGKKGKGYARPTFSSSSTASPVLAVHGAGKPGSPSYSGCFICGAKDHDFRSCPKRSKSGKGFGSGKVFMVEEAQELEETFVFHAWSEPERPLSVMKVGEVSSPEMEGFGVLDTGATETVCGLSALEWIMHKRAAAGASSGDFTVVDVPQKTFKFGNGMTQQSESLILLPQRLGEHSLSLGIYTLEANGVPVLVGIKTLTRLGAIRDTSRSAMVLTAIDASLLVPLKLSGSGHLLMDLAHDWLSQGTKILFTEELSGKQQYVPGSSSCFMVEKGSEVCESDSLHERHVHHDRHEHSFVCTPSSLLAPHELEIFESLDEPHAAEFLSQCFAVRHEHVGVHDHSSSPTAVDTEAQRTAMSWKALAILASTASLINSVSHVASSCCEGESQGKDRRALQELWQGRQDGQEEGHLGGEVRRESHGGCRPEGSSNPQSSLLGQPHSSSSIPWKCVREQWTCDMGGVRTLPASPVLYPGVRGDRTSSTSRSDPRGHSSTGGGAQRKSSIQPIASHSGGGIGWSRTFADEQAGQHQSSQGSSGICTSLSRLQRDHSAQQQSDSCSSDSKLSGRDPRRRGGVCAKSSSDRQGTSLHGSWEQIPPQRAASRGGGVRRPGGSLVVDRDISREANRRIELNEALVRDGATENDSMSEDNAIQSNDQLNSNNLTSENVRFLKNAEVPPNVKVPPNAHLFKNDPVMTDGKSFEPPAMENFEEDIPYDARLSDKDAAFAWEAMNELVMENDEIFLAHGGIAAREHWDVLELCCGPESLLIQAVHAAGGYGGRAGLHNHCDLTREEGVEKTLELLRLHRPRWIWASFPCGPTSAVQALNERTEEGMIKSRYRKRHARKVLRGGLRVLRAHLAQGGEIAWEWPKSNKAWRLPEVEHFWAELAEVNRAHEVLGDGCMFGLSSEDGPVKKPWRFMCTSPHALTSLKRECDGSHHHVPCLGQRAKQSAYYTPQLCRLAAQGMMKDKEMIGAVQEPEKETLARMTPLELQRLMESALKLHRLCGHPNNRAMLKLLQARGASEELKAAVMELKCPECLESQTAIPLTKVSTEREETLWRTLQMDGFYFRHANWVYHYILFMDEASSFAVVKEIKSHADDQSENVATGEAIEALEESWCQIFGYPSKLRCDAEGAFRGTALAQWCAERGIDMIHTPAEHHSSTGLVERGIGELRHKMEVFLRNEPVSPKRAAYAMVQAHNHVTRVGGYAPAQWAFGRSENAKENVAACCSEATPGHQMAENLRLRIEAEHLHNKLTASARLSRAQNSRSKKVKQYIPGDLVYYLRHRTPRRAPSNVDVDMPRMRIARWFGPARVLASETRRDETGTICAPSSTVWLVSCGRLLKTHMDQLRHASERELIIANASNTMATPWTFSMLTSSLQKGSFEDLTSSRAERFELKRKQTFRPPLPKRQAIETEDDLEYTPSGASESSEELVPDDDDVHMDPTLREGMHPDDSELDIERLLDDPQYMPLHPLQPPDPSSDASMPESSFKQARRKHEQEDRPHHAKFPKKYQNPDLVGWCSEPSNDMVMSVVIEAPQSEEEWRRILKDPKKFTAKSVQKGCEIAWHKLNAVQRQAMMEAKRLEVDSWVINKVVEKAGMQVPKSRLMKMRWVLVFKSMEDPDKAGMVKAKARIVILGFSDPDGESLDKAAPTLARRSRQLILNLACHRRWRTLKADVKAAFLQGSESQKSRDVFALPVDELGDRLQVPKGQAVRLLRAAYGLVSAPREWYRDVDRIATTQCGLIRLVCEPCVWICKDAQGVVQGVLASHVDDFIVTGNESNELWMKTLTTFHQALKWSPWEPDPYIHCGVEVHQQANYGFNLSHEQYASQIKQIEIDKSCSHVTPSELSQAKAVLGAIQWRVSQTAPQHAAKLSLLQSMLPHGKESKDVLVQINKLVREVFAQRGLSL